VPENPDCGGGGAKVQKLGKTWTRWEKLGWQARHNGTSRASPSHPYLDTVAAVTSRLAGCKEISPFLETTVLAANLTRNLQILKKRESETGADFPPLISPVLPGRRKNCSNHAGRVHD